MSEPTVKPITFEDCLQAGYDAFYADRSGGNDEGVHAVVKAVYDLARRKALGDAIHAATGITLSKAEGLGEDH